MIELFPQGHSVWEDFSNIIMLYLLRNNGYPEVYRLKKGGECAGFMVISNTKHLTIAPQNLKIIPNKESLRNRHSEADHHGT